MAKRKAGQFGSLSIMVNNGWSDPHPFSIASAPEDPVLCLTIKKVGQFTSAIPDLKPGTEVRCMGPLGAFCKDIDAKPATVMMAGGVGITPFLSVLRHFRNIKARNIATLFWVNRTVEDVFATDEIQEMTRDLNLRVIYCLSRADDVEGYYRQEYPGVFYEKGRLSGEILKRHGARRELSFYLCGPPPDDGVCARGSRHPECGPGSDRKRDFRLARKRINKILWRLNDEDTYDSTVCNI